MIRCEWLTSVCTLKRDRTMYRVDWGHQGTVVCLEWTNCCKKLSLWKDPHRILEPDFQFCRTAPLAVEQTMEEQAGKTTFVMIKPFQILIDRRSNGKGTESNTYLKALLSVCHSHVQGLLT